MATVFRFDVGAHGKVSAALYRAKDPTSHATLILAHGAGAPRTHPFMTSIATRIALRGVDVVTFNFLYAEAQRRMPDRVELLEATWRSAIATVRARGGLPTERLFIGGKSMGGRIATRIAAENQGLVITGVVLLGYPLHPTGKPNVVRGEIRNVELPMLVVQGTRDELGSAAEVKAYVRGMPRVRIHAVEGGDHSFIGSRRSGQDDVLDAVADAVATFVGTPRPAPVRGRSSPQRRGAIKTPKT